MTFLTPFLPAITALGTLAGGGAALLSAGKKSPSVKFPAQPRAPRKAVGRGEGTARQRNRLARRPGGGAGVQIGALGGGGGAVRPTLSGGGSALA